MKHIVFFASGSGSNFQAVVDAVKAGKVRARIRGLISNKKGSKALERARNQNIPVHVLSPSSFNSKEEYERALLNKLKKWRPDLIVLAGYLLKIPSAIIQQYKGKIINIHPSLLPKFGGQGFYGLKVHRAVLEQGETESGCSVHLVTEKYDEGPVLAQRKVPVHAYDTPEILAQRILEQEHKLLPKVIHDFLTNKNSNK